MRCDRPRSYLAAASVHRKRGCGRPTCPVSIDYVAALVQTRQFLPSIPFWKPVAFFSDGEAKNDGTNEIRQSSAWQCAGMSAAAAWDFSQIVPGWRQSGRRRAIYQTRNIALFSGADGGGAEEGRGAKQIPMVPFILGDLPLLSRGS